MWKYLISNRYCISCDYGHVDKLNGGIRKGLHILRCSKITNDGWSEQVSVWWDIDVPDVIYHFTSYKCPFTSRTPPIWS